MIAEPAPAWEEEGETEHEDVGDALADLGDDAPEAELQTDETTDEAIEIEETDATLEDMVNAVDLPGTEEVVGPEEVAEPGDLEAGEEVASDDYATPAPPEYPPAPSPFDDNPAIESEELFDLPPTPSWDEVAENCLTIAGARGAMLVDPQGIVLASHGSWPEPGPEAIAKKLVAMMEKTLKDAPTRSVSAPVGNMHLTAWRVPLAEGLLTVAFLGDTPLRPDARTPVDAEILRGAP